MERCCCGHGREQHANGGEGGCLMFKCRTMEFTCFSFCDCHEIAAEMRAEMRGEYAPGLATVDPEREAGAAIPDAFGNC